MSWMSVGGTGDEAGSLGECGRRDGVTCIRVYNGCSSGGEFCY
jgi:hypothetical protein